MAFLYEAIPSSNFSCAVSANASPATAPRRALLVTGGRAGLAAFPVPVFGQREPAGDELDERERLQRAANLCAHALTPRNALRLSTSAARALLEVTEPEVHVTDAQERRPLIVAIVARLAFRSTPARASSAAG